MWLHRAALAAVALASCAFAHAQAPDVLTLDDAFARVARTHPELALYGPRHDALAAEVDRAALRPAWTIGAEVENAFGTGETRALDGAELTLGLATVFERGGKLDARRTLAQRRIDALAIEREGKRLDLLAEVARRYLGVVAAVQQEELMQLDVAQRGRTVAGARHRLQAGAAPESVVLTAQAALARAELDRDRARQRRQAARQHLAALWGERAPSFAVATVDPLRLPTIASFDVLAGMIEDTPELAQFTDARRIAEARLQLARSEASADLDWRVGVRRLQASDDTAFVAGLSMPLATASRAQPGIRAAEAELAAVSIEREAKGLALYSTLADAHGRYLAAQLEVQRLGDDVIPKLTRAEAAAERAYRAGAISYLEWAQLQSERTAARRQRLETALEAQRALIELQRLTGQGLLAPSTTVPQQEYIP